MLRLADFTSTWVTERGMVEERRPTLFTQGIRKGGSGSFPTYHTRAAQGGKGTLEGGTWRFLVHGTLPKRSRRKHGNAQQHYPRG